jgi:hypothetical protein
VLSYSGPSTSCAPNTVNRDEETILNVLLHYMVSIHPEVALQDEEIYSFFYTTASRLVAPNRQATNPLLDKLASALPVLRSDASTDGDHVSSASASAAALSPVLDVNHRSGRYHHCAIHSIVFLEHEQYSFQFLLLLLDAGVDLGAVNEDGHSLLHQFVLAYCSPSHTFHGSRLKQVLDLPPTVCGCGRRSRRDSPCADRRHRCFGFISRRFLRALLGQARDHTHLLPRVRGTMIERDAGESTAREVHLTSTAPVLVVLMYVDGYLPES